MADLQVTMVPRGKLLPYAKNARIHTQEQVAQIAASIAEFGFVNPVLVDTQGSIIAGHGRVMAAERLGITDVPVITLGHLSPTQAQALRLADNQIALNSGWDTSLITEELRALSADGFNLDILGFAAGDVANWLNPGGGAAGDPDADAPEPPEHPVSRPGDIWHLGAHRIICGSSTDAATVARILAGEHPKLMVTDPPYGVNYDPEWRKRAGVNNSNRMGAVMNDDNADWREAWALFPGDVAYVWHSALYASTVQDSLSAVGFVVRSQIIWAKTSLVMGRGAYHWQHEPCWYAVRKTGKAHWAGDRKQSTLWSIPTRSPGAADDATVHSTQKPVECMRRPIVNNSKPGDAVYEPFSGSGTTIIAAEMDGRRCFAVELSPAYVDVAVRRWQQYSGKTAHLDGGGTFEEETAARGAPAAA